MKKIILIIILSIFANEVYSQDLRTLPKKKREKEIRKICKETILKYGDSRYWDENDKEEIVFFASYKDDDPELKNRPIYVVTYKTKENLELIERVLNDAGTPEDKAQNIRGIYSTMVLIFADTGKAATISWGRAGNLGFTLYNIKNTKSSVERPKMPYYEKSDDILH